MRPLRYIRPAVRLLLALLLLALLGLSGAVRAASVSRIDSIGITVGEMDRALAFYTGVLPFEVVSETEVQGDAYEHLFGKIVQPRREKYVSTKKAARPRSGSPAAQSIDLDDPKARRQYLTDKLIELESSDD